MLSLCRMHGQVTDFYQGTKHLLSIVTMENEEGLLDIHQVPEYVAGQETVEYSTDVFRHVKAEKQDVDIGNGVSILYYNRMIQGVPRLTLGIKAPKEIKVLRREVLIRDGLEK